MDSNIASELLYRSKTQIPDDIIKFSMDDGTVNTMRKLEILVMDIIRTLKDVEVSVYTNIYGYKCSKYPIKKFKLSTDEKIDDMLNYVEKTLGSGKSFIVVYDLFDVKDKIIMIRFNH